MYTAITRSFILEVENYTITLHGSHLIGGSFTECLDCMAGWSRFKLRRMQSLNTFILKLLITIPETTVSDPLLRSIVSLHGYRLLVDH